MGQSVFQENSVTVSLQTFLWKILNEKECSLHFDVILCRMLHENTYEELIKITFYNYLRSLKQYLILTSHSGGSIEPHAAPELSGAWELWEY